jgi:hypothetical protein
MASRLWRKNKRDRGAIPIPTSITHRFCIEARLLRFARNDREWSFSIGSEEGWSQDVLLTNHFDKIR